MVSFEVTTPSGRQVALGGVTIYGYGPATRRTRWEAERTGMGPERCCKSEVQAAADCRLGCFKLHQIKPASLASQTRLFDCMQVCRVDVTHIAARKARVTIESDGVLCGPSDDVRWGQVAGRPRPRQPRQTPARLCISRKPLSGNLCYQRQSGLAL